MKIQMANSFFALSLLVEACLPTPVMPVDAAPIVDSSLQDVGQVDARPVPSYCGDGIGAWGVNDSCVTAGGGLPCNIVTVRAASTRELLSDAEVFLPGGTGVPIPTRAGAFRVQGFCAGEFTILARHRRFQQATIMVRSTMDRSPSFNTFSDEWEVLLPDLPPDAGMDAAVDAR